MEEEKGSVEKANRENLQKNLEEKERQTEPILEVVSGVQASFKPEAANALC